MMSRQPSRTLLSAAIRRAEHQFLDTPLIFEDPIILDLVPELTDPAAVTELRSFGEPALVLLRSLFAMRNRFAEDRLAEAVRRGVRQYVMVGAGLDTFPWRQPASTRDMAIFAADHPASLIWTHRRLRDRGLARPPNLTHVPVDLEDCGLGDALAACGFDHDTASFCSVLGVVQYLSDNAIDALLRFAASLKTGSEIVFSFVTPDEELEGEDLEIAIRSVARTAALGEPWKTRVLPQELLQRLTGLGFSNVFHLTPELAQARYFAGRRDGLRAPRWEQLIAAVV
jgi:methyltransferase (TIGR00027 family)